jgi:hypothetical protein
MDLVLEGNRRNDTLRRIDEPDKALESGIAVDKVAELVAYDEAEFVFVHKVEEFRVDIDDMRLVALCCNREGVDL